MTATFHDSTLPRPSRTATSGGAGALRTGSAYLGFSPIEKLQRNLRRLTQFSRAGANWNGYGASAFDPAALRAAGRLLFSLGARQPFVSPLSDGGVQFDWHVGDEELELEVHADRYTFLAGDDEPVVYTSAEEVLQAFARWFAARV